MQNEISLNNWKRVELSEVLELVIDRRGVTPKKLGGNWSLSGIPTLSAKNIKSGQIVNKELIRFVTPELYDKWMAEKLHYGDVILTSEAPLGEAMCVNDTNYCLGQRLFALRPKREILNSKFLYYILKSKEGQDELHSRKTGTTAKGIRQSELVKVKILLPPVKEQQKIAEILTTVEEAIQTSVEIITKIQSLKKGLMQQLLTKGINHKKFKQTEIGEIPAEWEVTRLGDPTLSELIMGQSPPSSTYNEEGKGLPFLQGNADFNETYPTPTTYTTNPIKIAFKDDILISVRAPVGEVNISPFKCCIGRGLSAVRINPSRMDYLFAFYYIKQTAVKLTALSSGSTFKAIKKTDLENFRIAIQPVPEQQKIVTILSTVDEKLEFETKRKEHLQNVKAGLMNDLLTGKRRVKVEA